MRPLTREFDPQIVVAVPVWSPSGEWIAFLKSRMTNNRNVTLWLARPDGSDARDLGVSGVWACWAGDGRTLYYTVVENDRYVMEKRPVVASSSSRVRDDDAIGCQVGTDGTLYYARPLVQASGAWDLEMRRARAESGPSEFLGRVAAAGCRRRLSTSTLCCPRMAAGWRPRSSTARPPTCGRSRPATVSGGS